MRRALRCLCLLLPTLGACVDLVHNDALDHAATRALLARGTSPSSTASHPPPLDAALVLGCPSDDTDGSPSPCQRCRVKSALGAFRAGEVRNVIFSGGAAHNRFVEADTMAALAIRRGLPASAGEREGRALTTWMNLRYSARILRRRGWQRIMVISTAAHLPRVDRFLRALGMQAARFRACDLEPPDTDTP